MPFNIMDHPAAFTEPRRLTPTSAWIQHVPFAFVLTELARPRTIVELGVHQGDSYCAFCQAVELLKLPAKCFGVDTWRGDAHAGQYGQQVLDALRSNHDPLYGGFSKLIQSDFDGARGQFEDGSIDLLHIDGFHTYEAVKHDYETWLPKVSERGVVIFHDTTYRQRDFGVWRLWEELSPKFPSFQFEHGCGLGILAIGKAAPPEVLEWLKDANADAPGMRRCFESLGAQVERQRTLTTVSAYLTHMQSLMNEWRRHAGQPAEAVIADPAQLARTLASELHALATNELNLRLHVHNLNAEMQKIKLPAAV